MLSVAAIAVSTGLLLGTCGSTTEPATTVPGSTGADQHTTTTAPATTTTTTPSPAAGAPVVTLAPLTPEEAEVVAALYEARTLAIEAGMDPDAPGLDERLDAAVRAERSGAEHRRGESRLPAGTEGLRARINPDRPWELIVESA